MRPATSAALDAAGMDSREVARIVDTALREDLGPDGLDVTSVATIPADQVDTADLIARQNGVVAGLAVAAAVFETTGADTEVVLHRLDGESVTVGDVLATITGRTRELLSAERTSLNLLCRMS